MGKTIIPQLVLIGILTLINAFFASAEMAIVSINKNKIKMLSAQGDKKAQMLQRILSEPSKFLATIQVGITLAGFFASASAATGIASVLSGVFLSYNIPYAYEISLVIVTIILSYITLVFGELFPKRVALQKAEVIARFSIGPIILVSKIAYPFIKLLSMSTNLLVRIFRIDMKNLEEKVSEEEIRSLIQVGEETGVINTAEKDMIESIFKFDDILAKEIMVPRTEVFMMDIDESSEEIIKRILHNSFSRIPIYEGKLDNIIGVLYVKDILREAEKGLNNINLRELLRPPYFVHENKNIDKLFSELKGNKMHLAVLVDEYGGFSGIITMEDLIEEVMGNIFDEYDDSNEYISKIDNFTYIIKGITPLEDINKYFHLNIDSENVETLGGFIIEDLGRLPTKGEKSIFKYKDVTFEIQTIKHNRIEKVKMSWNNKKTPR